MTDRVISLVVALDSEMSTDDVQEIIDAIKRVKNVLDAIPNIFTEVDHMNAYTAKMRYKREIINNLIIILK